MPLDVRCRPLWAGWRKHGIKPLLWKPDLLFAGGGLNFLAKKPHGEKARALVAMAELVELGCSAGGFGVGVDVLKGMGSEKLAMGIVGDPRGVGLDRLRTGSNYRCKAIDRSGRSGDTTSLPQEIREGIYGGHFSGRALVHPFGLI